MQHSLLAARLSVPQRVDWFADTGGIQCVYRILYGNTCCACLFLTYNLDLTVTECHFCWPDWQETRVVSHWSDTNASSETTPTAPSKALRSQPRALIAIGCCNMCVQHSLLAARLSVPHRVDWWVDAGGIQCVYGILYGNTCCACSSPTILTWQSVNVTPVGQSGKKLESFLTEVTRTRPVRTTPTPSGKALRSKSRGYNTCVQHSLLAARLSVPQRVDWFADTGGIQCVYRILYGNTCCACLFPTYNLDLTVTECHFCWPDWQETRVVSHWSDTNASSETTPTAPSKALRSQPRALIAIGCCNMCVQHSLLAARLSVPHRVDWWVDTGGIQCVMCV